MKPPLTRVCKKCGEKKPLDEFTKGKACKFGRTRECKDCNRERGRKWRETNPEYHHKWREANREYLLEMGRKWRETNPEYHHKWRETNPEYHLEQRRKWCRANPKKVLEQTTRGAAKFSIRMSTGLSLNELPEEFIQYKILQLELNRKIKEHETS